MIKNPTLYAPAKRTTWKRLAAGAFVTSAVAAGGYGLKDRSPVHFMVEGALPETAPEWACEPEGGIIGAPVVCRYRGPAGKSEGSLVDPPKLSPQRQMGQDGQQN